MTAPLPTLRPRVWISAHAADRYRERVKPLLDRRQATAELVALLDHAELVDRTPGWAGRYDDSNATRWAVIADSICLPLVVEDRRLVAVTCLIRAGVGEGVREHRNRERSRRRARAQHRREKWRERTAGRHNRKVEGK